MKAMIMNYKILLPFSLFTIGSLNCTNGHLKALLEITKKKEASTKLYQEALRKSEAAEERSKYVASMQCPATKAKPALPLPPIAEDED